MRELINFFFKGREKQFIAITKLEATQTDDKNKFKITFNKTSLKLAINFLPGNFFFFNFGNFPFRQITGIRIGFDPALFKTNLFLYYHESNWLLDCKKGKKHSLLFIRFV